MSRIKKFSFVLIFLALMITGAFSVNFPAKTLFAASNSENTILSVQKVAYTNDSITIEEEIAGVPTTRNKKLGEYSSEELYANLTNIKLSAGSSVKDNEVVSIDRSIHEALLVILEPNREAGRTIVQLSVGLKINGTDIYVENYPVNGNSLNQIYVKAFDFTTLETTPFREPFDNLSGKYEFFFNYVYSTNSNDKYDETKYFNFYLIDHEDYFIDSVLPNISNTTLDSNLPNTYYYNYQDSKNTPKLNYNPKKYQPTITYKYNETQVTLTTSLNETADAVIVTSSDNKILPSKIIKINNDLVSLELNRLGQYQIEYNLVIDNSISIDVIPTQQTQMLPNFPVQTLNVYGFEAYYTNYDENNDHEKNYYKQFHDDKYLSDFSFVIAPFNSDATDTNDILDIDGAIDTLANYYNNLSNDNEKLDFRNSIAVTNQAPVKLDAYITELNNASFIKLNEDLSKNGTIQAFSTSKRFGSGENETGLFAVFLNYNFGTISNKTQLIVFEIENSTPEIKLTDINGNPLPTNNFTNSAVKVAWDGVDVNPFSVAPKITFNKNGTNITTSTENQNFQIFESAGEYLVTIKYGINHTTSVTKTFNIDYENITFELYNIYKDRLTNNYLIKDKLSLVKRNDNVIEYRTNSPFSIFALNKLVASNKISLSYEYMPINEGTGDIDYIFNGDKLYIYNNKVLDNVYLDLTYTNNKINNLTNFSELNNYNFNGNNTAVISNSGLYKFIITDYAKNTQTFFVLLDNTDPIALHTNDVYNKDVDYDSTLDGTQNTLEDWLKSRADDLQIKKDGINFVSNNYSLIVGNGKFVKFDTDKAPEFAEEYFGQSITGIQNIYQDYEDFRFEQTNGKKVENIFDISSNNNIAFITAPKEEIDVIYKATFTLNGIEYYRKFNLNTDKNQILIYGYNETNGYYKIYTFNEENITNTKYLYVRFLDDYTDNYKLKELTLDFYPFKENNKNLELGQVKTIDLLSIKETCNIPENEAEGVLSGGYITSIINPTYTNSEYITNQGKYVLTKTYAGYNEEDAKKIGDSYEFKKISQNFFVDRHLPIEYISPTLTIGDNIYFTFNNEDTTLSAQNILYYIQNNQSVITNKLPITSSLNTYNKKYSNSELSNFILYYEIYKGNLNDNICLYSSNPQSPYYNSNGYNFTSTGSYTFKIFDNSGYSYNKNTNINPNSISFKIEITNDAPNGYFVIDSNEEIVESTSSTNSNSLSFVFNDSTSNFLYDIDIFNIILTRNGTNILRTFETQNEANSRYIFNLNNTIVYYESSVGGIFTLQRTALSSTKIPNANPRYSYKLTIINPDFDSALVLDGKSLEAEYKLSISYIASEAVLNGLNYTSKDYIMYIDHTSPYSNINRYIDNDKFLTLEEKEILKQSVANKDRSPEINFENYTFLINEAPKTLQEGLALLDTSSIYIRKYNKYNDSEIADYQSLVYGDSEFDKQITTRYKFDVNALDNNGNNIYTSSKYNLNDLNSFFNGAGFYEIIERDNAQNYTIYSVYYNPAYEFSVDYSYVKDSGNDSGEEDLNNITIDSIANGLNFTLDKININDKDYLNVKLSINGNVEYLRYLPFEMQSTNLKYFDSLSEMINYINNVISNDSKINALGSQYIIELTNRNGSKISITNNTPNEQLVLNIIDYSDYFTVEIPNDNAATYVTEFNVYPVIDGEISTDKLSIDSDGKQITSTPNSSYRFTNKVGENNISIYYIEWTDNFNRTQYKVKTIGTQDIKYINYGEFNTQIVNNIEYTANENAKLIYSKNLYRLEIYYSILPDLYQNQLLLTSDNSELQTKINNFITINGNTEEINLLQILKLINGDQTLHNQIQFTINLTDLSTLAFNNNLEETIYTLTYVYYPTLPNIYFTDSASNDLNIAPISENTSIVSTSKNVTLSYVNTTLFNINISVIREYTNEFEQTLTETIDNISNEYTFTALGNYTVKASNILGKENIYKFNIKTASNKTYTVYTFETNMDNYELTATPIKITYNIEGNDIPCETYYSIYNTIVEVNTDFNLEAQIIEINDYTKVYKIIKVDTQAVYKYIATVKMTYNSNFLNVNNETDSTLQIFKGIDDINNIANNLMGYSIKVADDSLKISLPLYNTEPGNLINVYMYYNNELISLNKNIYSTDETSQTILLENTPAGVYNFYFEDLAGNTQLFNGNAFLNVLMFSEVITSINGKNPIDYQIYNSSVNLKIEQEKQYNTRSIEIIGYKNGDQIQKLTRNTIGEYVFTEYGLYKIEIKASITVDGREQQIYKTLHFTILNEKEAFKEFSYIGLNGQTITKIIRDGIDVTNEIKKFVFEGNSNTSVEEFNNAILYNLNLASLMSYYTTDPITGEIIGDLDYYNGAGHYQIFVDNQNSLIDSQNFTFNVWIRERNVKILLNSSLEEGGSTTKAIIFTYNPYLIYTQIGECAIYLNENKVIEINENSENTVNTYTIPRESKGTFIVQVRSDSGNTELSFIVNKKEPLSTVTIIVIIIVSAVVALGTFLFIKLRTRMRVK